MTHPASILARMAWLPPGKLSEKLSSFGFVHEFAGVGDPPPKAHHARQVHGTKVIRANPATAVESTRRTEADGIWTEVAGETVAVRTADCLPILLADRVHRRFVAAVHAGWRGLTSGILGEAIGLLGDLVEAKSDIVATIGPTISTVRFEVGPEVIAAVLGGDFGLTPAESALCVIKGKGDRWHVDLTAAAALALVKAGLDPEGIAIIQACTWEEKAWHSYRREGRGVASNWSWIRL